MTVQNKPWERVAKDFDAIGDRLRQQVKENVATESDRAAFDKAVHALLSALDDSLQAASRIARDAQLRADLKEFATSMRAAVQETFGEARDKVTTTVKRSHHEPEAHKRTGTKATAHKTPPGGKPAAKSTHH